MSSVYRPIRKGRPAMTPDIPAIKRRREERAKDWRKGLAYVQAAFLEAEADLGPLIEAYEDLRLGYDVAMQGLRDARGEGTQCPTCQPPSMKP